ncbi:MAG: VOC family protein [Rhodomicrobium sp.]
MPRSHTATPSPKPAAKAAPAAKTGGVQAIPEGFHTITPSLTVSDAEAVIALYQKAFNAEVKAKMHAPGGKKIVHSCLQIGSSKIFVQDEMPGMAGPKHRGASFYVYVPDVDAQHKRAVAAGLTEMFPPTDMFWGDRTGVLADPFGNHWTLATHIRNPSEAEMAEAMKEWAAKGKAH